MLKNKFWSFHGKDEDGKSMRGIIDAPNKAMAHYMLLKIGIKKINFLIKTFSSYRKIFHLNSKEKLHLFASIYVQLAAGINIITSLESIKIDTNSFKIKYLLFIILKNLHEGHQLSQALEKIEYKTFSKTELSLIQASEISGHLETTLKFICEKLESKLFINQKLISALIYPAITLLISFILAYIIFTWIIPQFETVFLQNNQTLPWLTQCIFFIANYINTIFIIFLVFVILLYIICRLCVKYQLVSRQIMESSFLKIPIIGKTTLLGNRINFCHTLSTLLSAGISLYDTLNEAIEQINLPYSQIRLRQAFKEIILGKNLSTSLRKTHFFPSSAIQNIAIAENTGRLDQAFKIIGQQFSNELSVFYDHIGKIIEPFILILLGVIIGVIVIAIYLPIFQLGNFY